MNEVEATAKKGARGAGFDWGVAEEAGRAARWLCSNGLGGCGHLARYLERASDTPCFAPNQLDGPWRSNRGHLCPLRTGAALSDLALRLRQQPVEMQSIASPARLLPFAAWAALALDRNVTLSMGAIEVVTDGVRVSLTALEIPADSDVRVKLGGDLAQPLAHYSRAAPHPENWKRLNALAHKTYAPATEESRLLGAGAGLSDND